MKCYTKYDSDLVDDSVENQLSYIDEQGRIKIVYHVFFLFFTLYRCSSADYQRNLNILVPMDW